MKYQKMWKIIYKLYPPILRLLEKIKIHQTRQKYLIGHLAENSDLSELEKNLIKNGFEKAILSWKDQGEIINMRLIDNRKYQYHLRIFNDGEVRGHYELSPEADPWGHVFEKVFLDKKNYFISLLDDVIPN
jgi:hypothetical protein